MRETMEERSTLVSINLWELLLFYVRKWWVLALCTVVCAAGTYGVTKNFVTPLYQAEVSIYVNNMSVENKEYLSSSDVAAAQRLVNTYVSIAKSERVLDKIAQRLDGAYTARELEQLISASQLNSTEIFCIYATHPNADEAVRIANAAAEVAPEEISGLIDGTSARVIDMAKEAGWHSPNYSRNTILGGAIGLIVALIYLTIRFLTDTRIKDENDLTDICNVPILGRIPEFGMQTPQNSYGYAADGGENKETNEA